MPHAAPRCRRRPYDLALVLLVWVAALLDAAPPAGAAPLALPVHKYSTRVVHTKYGALRGVLLAQQPVEAFLGVPYASAPVGSLRYMPPVTPSKWRGTRLADAFSPVCPQRLPDIANRSEALLRIPRARLVFLERLLPLLANQSEDCLYMNIYVPQGGKSPFGSKYQNSSPFVPILD